MHGDSATAWALHDELIKKGLSPDQDTWEVLFRGGQMEAEQGGSEKCCSGEDRWRQNREGVREPGTSQRLLAILLNMRNNQVYPQERLPGAIKSWFESLPRQKWKAGWTTITPKGVCRCCGSLLESIQLTTEEHQQLKDVVMTRVHSTHY